MAKVKKSYIITSTIQLFVKRGYDGTTILMIAEKASADAINVRVKKRL